MSQLELQHHMNLRHDDGQWACDHYSYQINSKYKLSKHIESKHSAYLTSKCDHCNETFGDKAQLRKHILVGHKSHRPCQNFGTDGEYRYGDLCYFSHTPVPPNLHRCYKCGIEVPSVSILMDHRKSRHKDLCKDALLKKCRFSQTTCYLNHENDENT